MASLFQDCIVDDTVSPEECPAAPDMPKNGPPPHTLCFKITNRVPYKTVVKGERQPTP